MSEIRKHIDTIGVMQCKYSHIRRNDDEWNALEAAKEALTAQAERERNGGWISVADRLPDVGEDLIIHINTGTVFTG